MIGEPNIKDPAQDELDDNEYDDALEQVNAAIARIKKRVAYEMENMQKLAVEYVPSNYYPPKGWIEETVDEVFHDMRQYLIKHSNNGE